MENSTHLEAKPSQPSDKPLKLNLKRTFIIGFAFFGILLLWQVYDSWCPTLLTQLFSKALGVDPLSNSTRVQYLVGIVMAMDNLAALILLPIFGKLSDKTKTPLGKRMPYILVGTFVVAVAFPFIPLLYMYNNLAGFISLMGVVVVIAMAYRNPAVSLMPDMTPKPLRSKANGIINIMGYIGGACATVMGIFFKISDFLGTGKKGTNTWAYDNIWAIELPFIIASFLMVVSAIVLLFTIRENKILKEVEPEMLRGEEMSEALEKVEEEKPMPRANLIMLWVILIAEFFWFMADNGIATFMTNYTIYYLGAESSNAAINTIIGGVGSVIGFAFGGIIASKITRKWTVLIGLALTLASYVVWAILTFSINLSGTHEFPIWIFVIWFIKGIGMSLVHVNSFPMVVELCPSSKIGAYTGYYYASSMAAQTITPIALGSLLFIDSFDWNILPIYASICVVISLAVCLFIKSKKVDPNSVKKGLEAFDGDD